MRMEFNITITEEVPKYLRIAILQTKAVINGREYTSRENISEDADPVFFDYVWEKIGKEIKEEYLKTLK